MLKKFLLVLVCVLSFFEIGRCQDLTLNPRDTLYLNKGTHISNILADWDSMVVKVMRGTNLVERIKLTKYDTGEYGGTFKPTYLGNFVAIYYAYYGSYKVREEQNFSVSDTAAFMGAAAGLTAQEIVDSLVGRGWFPGTGIFACTISVRDSSLEAGINAVHVIIRNNDESAVVRHGWTNADGLAFFGLDSLETDASYKVWLLQLGYNFNFPETMDVRESATFTCYGTAFAWGETPPDSQTAVVGQVFNPFADSMSGVRVMAKVYIPDGGILHYHNFPITTFEVGDTTDASGRFQLNLLSNDVLWPQPNYYIFNFLYPTKNSKYFIMADTVEVPYSASPVEYGTLKGW